MPHSPNSRTIRNRTGQASVTLLDANSAFAKEAYETDLRAYAQTNVLN